MSSLTYLRRAVGSGAALAALATVWLLLGGAARAAGTGGGCTVPAGVQVVASVAGVRVWRQSVPTPVSVRRQYGAGARYPVYSGCAPGNQPHVLFRDYTDGDVGVRVAGDYVGLLAHGGTESLYLSDMLTGRTVSSRSFTPSVQDNGGSEANEPGPLVSWMVTSGGWLVYLDTLADFEGYGAALVAFNASGATTLDLAPNGLTPGATELGRVQVRGSTVSWWSSFSGTHRMKLRQALLPAALPKPLPSACQLVPRSLAQRLLGPLAATPPPAPHAPPAGFRPRVSTGTDRSGCAYAAAADPTQTIDIAVQRVTPVIVSRQLRAISHTPRADNALVLGGTAAVLFQSTSVFSPSGREDLRLFINDIEVDVTTNYDHTNPSDGDARYIENIGLAIERALGDAAPAASHV